MSEAATATEKPEPKKFGAAREDKLSRIPVATIVFNTLSPYEGPGSQVSNLTFGRIGKQPRWYTCSWLPAWQTFEIVYHVDGADDIEDLIHVSHVRKWRRE